MKPMNPFPLIILLAGAFAATKIPVLQFPQIESTSLQITTAYFGASAEVVQGFITETIEKVAMTIPGVDYVDSTTTAGTSRVTAYSACASDSQPPRGSFGEHQSKPGVKVRSRSKVSNLMIRGFSSLPSRIL